MPMPIETPNIFVTLLAFLVLIGTLVIIHELGHYLMGRWFGVKAEKFSVGFGPQLYGRVDKRGTLWRIGALPLGGYVQFAGDLNGASQSDANWVNLPEAQRNQTFQSKALWQRALIIFAGPAINFLFAILLLSGFLLVYGQMTTPAIVSSIMPDSAAAQAGIQVDDRIISVNGTSVANFQELATEVLIYPEQVVPVEFVRGDETMQRDVKIGVQVMRDRFGNEMRKGVLGIQSSKIVVEKVNIFEAPFIAAKDTVNIVRLTLKTLGQMIAGQRSVKELGGPIKIAKISGEQFSLGIPSFIWLAAMISINLGFMNLLPIPMLDGGHLMLYAIEAVRRRPATPQVQEWAFRAGFAMLIGFMVMVTFNDLASFGLFGG
jgi:regulator of sigma E protease